MRRAARTDANKQEIVDFLRAAGCSVYDLKQPVDLLIGKHNRTVLCELKDGRKPPSAQRFTKAQESFLATWRGGAVVTIRDIEGARTLVRMLDA